MQRPLLKCDVSWRFGALMASSAIGAIMMVQTSTASGCSSLATSALTAQLKESHTRLYGARVDRIVSVVVRLTLMAAPPETYGDHLMLPSEGGPHLRHWSKVMAALLIPRSLQQHRIAIAAILVWRPTQTPQVHLSVLCRSNVDAIRVNGSCFHAMGCRSSPRQPRALCS